MALSRRKHKKNQLISMGNTLVQEFVQTFNNEVLILSLKEEARQNEARTVNGLTALGARNSMYVTPQDIPAEEQENIAKESLNAHMQKAQALQAEAYNADQLRQANTMLRDRYIGHKVAVRVLARNEKPVDMVQREMMSGRKSTTQVGIKKFSGVITAIDLAGNFITIKPGLLTKSVNHSLEFYTVYIVNPANLQPMVSLSIK